MVRDLDLTAEESADELWIVRETLERLVRARLAGALSRREAQDYVRLAGRERVLLCGSAEPSEQISTRRPHLVWE